ncbi:MBL fold metallo-hydrolase [Nocardia sp. NPDC050408]|uniref:MBL fold metallo-hydrolase n=1 Tax=Nocardia sp. NPDC050408 TaxID=3364319 RepID=UPI00378E9947
MTVSPDRLTRPGALRIFEFGDHRITYLPDGFATLDPCAWLPESTEQLWRDHLALLNAEGDLTASIGGLLVEHGDQSLLIDTGFGPSQIPTPFGLMVGGQLLESLAAVDKTPADIDVIALTHLHLDHIGWLWQTTPASPFADTPVLVGDTEWDKRDLALVDGISPQMLDVFADHVNPIADGEDIFPGVRAIATPGHSLGHTGFVISSRGHRLIAFGDAMQTPIQISHPHLTAAPDDDPAQSVNTAKWLLDELTAPYTLGFGLHFADVQLGSVTDIDGVSTWRPQ